MPSAEVELRTAEILARAMPEPPAAAPDARQGPLLIRLEQLLQDRMLFALRRVRRGDWEVCTYDPAEPDPARCSRVGRGDTASAALEQLIDELQSS